MESDKPEQSLSLEVEVTIGSLNGVGEKEYAVAYATSDKVLSKGTVITFSIKYWSGKIPPQKGQVAVVNNVKQFVKGWRAFSARPVSPATSK